MRDAWPPASPSVASVLAYQAQFSFPRCPSYLDKCPDFTKQTPVWNGPRDALTQKKAGFPCSGLNAGSYFISQDEGMTESPVETLEKAIVLHLFWTEGLTSF